MLRQVAEGVLIRQSEFCQGNAVVVRGRAGVPLIDPRTTRTWAARRAEGHGFEGGGTSVNPAGIVTSRLARFGSVGCSHR